jgi:ribonuclease HI
MLEKVVGCCLVDKLRSILLMDADYNANNKEMIGNKMLANVRAHGLMMEEIFSEVGCTAEDGALSKILFYDVVWQCRLTAAISLIDAANCYDSIAHAIASLIFQACGMPVEGVEAMQPAIQDMKYFLRTAFGDSRNFRGSKIEIKYQGLCQGNGAAPAGWAAISITILSAHKKKGHSATFMCPMTNKTIKLAAILYVDDCDLIHIDMTCNDDVYTTFQRMQESVLNWGKLLIASGGSYKPPKFFYHLISFSWSRDGKWKYEENHLKPEFEMMVPMPDGTTAVIDHLPITEAKET